MSQQGNRNVAQRGKSQGRENITHRETGSSSYGGSRGLGPTGEDRAVLLQYQLDQHLTEQGSWGRKNKVKEERAELLHQLRVGSPVPPPTYQIKINVNPLSSSNYSSNEVDG